MTRVYIGNLDTRVTERDLEDECGKYGKISNIWLARKPPGFAFIDFSDPRDADDAIRKLDGSNGGWRVELSRKDSRGGGGGGGGGGRDFGGGGGRDFGGPRGGPRGEMRCYQCGEVGHIARDCRSRGGGGGGGGYDRGRDIEKDRYRRRSRSEDDYDRGRRRSPSPRRRSPSRSRSRGRSRS